MDYSYIKRTLNNLNINFDQETINNVVQFLSKQIGPVPNEERQYHIYAASAIVSECSLIPNINNSMTVNNGIRIENIMRYLAGFSKQKFLNIVSFQVNKWNKAPSRLLPKIESLLISYRVFKKYKEVFYNLAEQSKLSKTLANNLSPLFWIIYLFVKNKQKDPSNDHENTLILAIMLKYIFGTLINHMQQQLIEDIILAEFKQLQTPSPQKQKYYFERFYQNLQHIYTKRLCKPYSFQHILQNQIVLQRLTDDISNDYNSFFIQLPKWYIDQMTYLQLSKTLTPQIFTKVLPDVQPINHTINFDDDDQNEPIEEQQAQNKQDSSSLFNNLPQMSSSLSPKTPYFAFSKSPKSPFSQIQAFTNKNFALISTLSPFRQPVKDHQINNPEATPLTKKFQNMRWITVCLSQVTDKHYKKISEVYSRFRKDTFNDYKNRIQSKVLNAIDEFDCNCIDKNQRQKQMLKLFVYFLSEKSQTYTEQENKQIFGKDQSLNPLLCLSVEIFNFSYRTLRQSQYIKYCEIFEVNPINAFKPINWIGKRFTQLPKGLTNHLYMIQKHILIKQLWQNSIGYKLLKQIQDKESMSNDLVKTRLLKHIVERVEEICEQIKVQLKYVDKILSLVKSIINLKPQLLKFNKMDQIILNSIAFCLNQCTKKANLQDLFKDYNMIQTSSNSYRGGMKGLYGEQHDLLDFYNEVFLPEMQDMLKTDNSFLMTPIRLNYLSKRNNNMSETNPITFNFRDSSNQFFGNKKQKAVKNSYIKGLAFKLKRQEDPQKLIKVNEEIQIQEKQQQSQKEKVVQQAPLQLQKRTTFGKMD